MQYSSNTAFLFRQLLGRELAARYRTTVLGAFWLVLQPLLMLGVYTIVFSGIFKARWPGAENTREFALMLFAGLVPFMMFSEILVTAPGIVASQPNYVKKVVFPLPVLAVTKVAAALVTGLIGLAVLFLAKTWFAQPPSGWVMLAPAILAEMIPMMLATGWLLASLGVYLRDISQFVGVISSVLLFLSPIFFPVSAMPEAVSGFLRFNPLVTPIEAFRAVAVEGLAPDFMALARHFAISTIAAVGAYFLFRRLSRGFADVL